MAEREERLKTALRDNLKKRKEQSRKQSRTVPERSPGEPTPADSWGATRSDGFSAGSALAKAPAQRTSYDVKNAVLLQRARYQGAARADAVERDILPAMRFSAQKEGLVLKEIGIVRRPGG